LLFKQKLIMIKLNFRILFLSITLSLSTISLAQKEQKLFIDSLDNAFDISHYLFNLHGLLPIVSPITEPAVGYGATLASLYFIPKKKDSTKYFQMPDIVAVAGGLTENNTWFAGGGYIGFWKDDHIRYRGILGYGDIKLKYFGDGYSYLEENPIHFSISSTFLLQQAMFRISDSRFMLGGKYIFTKSTVTIRNNSDLIDLSKDFNLTNSGIGLITEFENYDNVLSPNKGLRINLTYLQFSEIFGGDRNFGRLTFFTHYYIPLLNKRWISGFRIESQLATGEPPFYTNPFIMLRGLPAMRYQGDLTALVETEQLFLLTPRWGINTFGGVGSTFNIDKSKIEQRAKAWNLGLGFRYLIARKLGLRMGIDLAKGPEDWGVYIIFASAWIK